MNYLGSLKLYGCVIWQRFPKSLSLVKSVYHLQLAGLMMQGNVRFLLMVLKFLYIDTCVKTLGKGGITRESLSIKMIDSSSLE